MKYHEPRLISLLNASVVTSLYCIFMITGFLAFSPDLFHRLTTVLFIIISALILFICSFLAFRYTLEKFIYSKIRLIYKSIHRSKTKKGEKSFPNIDGNFLEKVNEEVAGWQDENSREIEQLRQMEQYRRDFIGNVSHELKTPLFHIQGYILTLLDGGLEDPAINREYLKRTEKNIERLIRIVENLDEIAQLESGQMKLSVTRFDIAALVRESIELLEVKAKQREISMVVAHADKPVPVEGDREKIRQVIINLLENSIRYGIEKGHITVGFFDMDEHILTEVTDNGIGIGPAELPRVFERFYRAPGGRAAFTKGKGLGLSIVKHIVEAHQQTINVRSTPGVGTTFGFTLRKAQI